MKKELLAIITLSYLALSVCAIECEAPPIPKAFTNFDGNVTSFDSAAVQITQHMEYGLMTTGYLIVIDDTYSAYSLMHIPDAVKLTANGKYIFVGCQYRILIIDRNNPTVVAQSISTTNQLREISVYGRMLFTVEGGDIHRRDMTTGQHLVVYLPSEIASSDMNGDAIDENTYGILDRQHRSIVYYTFNNYYGTFFIPNSCVYPERLSIDGPMATLWCAEGNLFMAYVQDMNNNPRVWNYGTSASASAVSCFNPLPQPFAMLSMPAISGIFAGLPNNFGLDKVVGEYPLMDLANARRTY